MVKDLFFVLINKVWKMFVFVFQLEVTHWLSSWELDIWSDSMILTDLSMSNMIRIYSQDIKIIHIHKSPQSFKVKKKKKYTVTHLVLYLNHIW